MEFCFTHHTCGRQEAAKAHFNPCVTKLELGNEVKEILMKPLLSCGTCFRIDSYIR